MLEVTDMLNENPACRAATIDLATADAKSLIGYQVEIDDGVYAGVFVIVQVKKSLFMKKTLYRLTARDRDEFWIRLKRNKKAGQLFRPLRRVVDVRFESREDANDDDRAYAVLMGNTGDLNKEDYAVELEEYPR
jgi:predicted acetyltransferase